jgi:hypothetical protein
MDCKERGKEGGGGVGGEEKARGEVGGERSSDHIKTLFLIQDMHTNGLFLVV